MSAPFIRRIVRHDYAPPAAAEWSTTCLNCGAPLASAFCGDCGQRAVPPHPTVKELAGDALAEFSGWDGKFIETLRLLLRKPGELTRQFVDGRRVRFISPVRLYLTLSLVYFVASAAAPDFSPKQVGVAAGGVQIGITGSKASGAEQAAKAAVAAHLGDLTAAERDSALAQVVRAPRFVKPVLQRAINDPAGFKRGMIANMPRLLFLLVPVFAGIVGIFYRRRHYPEHLYFALHLHAFAFLALLLATVSKFSYSIGLAAVIGVFAELSIPVYAFFALRRVYGDSTGATLAKMLGIGALYLLVGGAAMLCLVYWAAVST